MGLPSCRALLALVLFCGFAAAQAQEAGAVVSGTPAGVENSMAQRMQACVLCHGKEGRSTNGGYFPRIAGKPAGYLYNQLRNFKTGRRQYGAMNYLVQNMSDDYLHDIANYFSELDLPYPPAQAQGLTPPQQHLAEGLVFTGSAQRQIPACTSCHGQQLVGRVPATPGLLGLPPDYLIAQLGGWRTGGRQAMAPDCMAKIANRLTPEEIGAVARWLSAQTLSPGTRPAPAAPQPLSFRCGSGE